jgi:ribonuclease BN (tRNA processing enzyme)
VEVEVGGQILVLDAGSGIIRLGDELLQRAAGRELHLTLLITHGHSDHLLGLPFFAPLYQQEASIAFFAPRLAGREVEELVTPLMSPPYFPVDIHRLPSRRTFYTLTGAERLIWRAGQTEPALSARPQQARVGEVHVSVHLSSHHPLNGSAVYCIEYDGRKLVFATDVEWRDHCEPAFLAFVEGANLLIHDAQYTPDEYRADRQGFGHSSIVMATEAASEAHVGRLVLFHHEPTHDDEKIDALQEEARQHFAQTSAAYEGLEIDL